MKVVVDVFGGDYAPDEILKGCEDALIADKSIKLALLGDENVIKQKLNVSAADLSRVEIFHAPEIITNHEAPVEAIKTKKESSLVKALEYLKTEQEAAGLISAGSTGAVLAGGLFKVGRIKGISRPALAPVLPNIDGGNTLLIDCGANMDCKPLYLAHFALMGDAYMKSMYGVKNPRVALLSVGVEDKKGNELTKAAFSILKQLPINFVGNMEARDCLSGEYDVLVSDGFIGNVAMKSMEGTLNLVLKTLKSVIMSNLKTKIGGALIKKKLKSTLSRLDYTKMGGAPFLGVEKVVVKNHGSSKAETVTASIFQVVKMAENRLVEGIKAGLANMPEIEMPEQ